MIQIEFKDNGTISIFQYNGGRTLHVTDTVDQLSAMLPPAVFDDLRLKMAAFLDLTGRPEPKIVNPVLSIERRAV